MGISKAGFVREKPTLAQVLIQLSPFYWQGDASWKWNTKVPLWTGSGEMEAFCELFFDNLATLLGVTGSAVSHVGYGLIAAGFRAPPAAYNTQIAIEWEKMYYEWHIPACGIALVFGNVWFAWLATRLATKENRLDVTAQPYGMNTTVIFITIYAMTLPALELAQKKYNIWSGMSPEELAANPPSQAEYVIQARKAAEYGWKVSVSVNFIIGLFEVLGFFLGDLIRWALPTAAVYVPLAGVGFTWLAFSPMISIAKEPIMCFLPFIIVVTGFFGNVRYPVYGKITFPIALMAIGFSTIFGWAGGCKHDTTLDIKYSNPCTFADEFTSVASFYNGVNPSNGMAYETCQGTDGNRAKIAWDTFAFKGDIFGGFGKGIGGLSESALMSDWAAPAILFGMIGFLGTMTCVESAEAAGDKYPMAEVMIVDGLGTMIGAIFGGMFGTSVYIGHPVHKALGAKIGYSLLNGVAFLFLLSSGMFAWLYNVIPGCANGAILVFVGLLLSRQAFEESPPRHYPCLLLGLMPFICNLMQLESKGNHSVNMGVQMMAPAGGVVFGIILCAICCFALDRKFEESVFISCVSALLSLFGIFASHNDIVDMGTGVRGPEHQTLGVYDMSEGRNNGWKWAIAWTMTAAFFACHIPFQKGNPRAFMETLPPRIEDDDADPYDVIEDDVSQVSQIPK